MKLCFPRLQRVCAADSPPRYLERVLGADGQDLVLEVAELAAPGAPLADPADEAGLMGAAHGAVAAAGAQQLPLQDTRGRLFEITCRGGRKLWEGVKST